MVREAGGPLHAGRVQRLPVDESDQLCPVPVADRAKQPRFIQNRAGKLECRVVNVRIEKSQSVLLRGMEGSTLGVWIAHGEGRCYWPDAEVKAEAERQGCVAMKYVDNEGNVGSAAGGEA